MIKIYLSLFLVIFSLASAKEEIEPYLVSECDTFSLIDGVVNACNGKLVQIDRDIQIRGSDPLELVRHYDGGHRYTGGYGYGVGLGYPLELKFNPEWKSLTLEHRMGAPISFYIKKIKVKDKHEPRYVGGVSGNYLKLGYMNNCEAQLRGEPSLSALKVEGDINGFVVTLGNGTRRHYHFYIRYKHSDDYYYRLSYEERPNGNRRHFYYTQRDNLELQTVLTTNPAGNLVINRIDFTCGNGWILAKGSNGQEVRYQIEIKKGFELLTKVSGKHIPETQYDAVYHKHNTDARYSLEKVTTPDGRHLQADIKFQHDCNHNVKKLFISGQEEPIYTFSYSDHHTVVRNALGAEKELQFSKRRLIETKEDHRRVYYDWDKYGQLIKQIVEDHSGNLISKKLYGYDERGNIVAILVKAHITNNKIFDKYLIKYTYSDDGRNLLLKEQHNGNEKEYLYNYFSISNLIESKLTLSHGAIVEREFFWYDGNALLVSKIVDDGSQPDRQNLQDVTHRKVIDIDPQIDPNQPGLTLPRQITEWAQNSSGQRSLLTRKECRYTQGDLLAEEKVYNSNDVYCYSRFWEYNDKRQLVSETNALGEKTLYAYDGNGNLIYEEKVGSGKKDHKLYDAANHVIEEIEEHPDRILSTRHTYDAMGNKTSTTDPFGQTTTFEYDKLSREIAKTDPLGMTERKSYDAQDYITKTIDKDGYATYTEYNLYGSPFTIRYPDGTKKDFEYNLFGHLVQEWNRDGTYVVHHVDHKGRATLTTTFAENGTALKTVQHTYKGDNLVTEIDAMSNATKYEYDGAGRQIAKIQGTIITRYCYDSLGRLARTTIGERVDIKEYDHLDRVIEERTEDLAGHLFSKVQYSYDINGNRQTKREYIDSQNFTETTTLYNAESLPVMEIDALGNQTRFFYHRTDHLEKETINPAGRRTFEIFDALDRLREVKIFSPLGILQARTSFEYDGRGNRTLQLEEIIRNGVSTGIYAIKYAYDEMGQKSAETEQGSKTTQFTYNLGRLHTIMKPDGVTLTHQYDSLGRLQDLVSSDGTINYHYDYDLNDNLLNAHDHVNGSVTTRVYDYLNRVIREKLGSGYISLYAYDEQNRMNEMVFYGIHVVYNYSPARLIAASRYQEERKLYTYTQKHNAMGKIMEAVLPNQTTLTYQWDKLGRCTQIQSPVYTQSLAYDAVGNLTQTVVQDAMESTHASYRYDDLDQLIEESGPFANSYNYDSIHNLHIKNQTPRSIDGLNQLTHDGATNYQYDPNGRRIAKGNAKYTYDALGRLLSYTNENTHITYIYDPFGRRLRSTTSECVRDYIYQLDTEIGVIVDNHLKEFRMIVGKNAPVSMEFEDAFFYPIRNHRGDICQLLDPNGVPASVYRYDAFGLFTHSGEVHSPWLFSGQRYDHLTGLYHYDKREYDPNTGRWLTPDPLGFVDGPNLFAYVQNNPLIYVDPYGLFWESICDFFHGFGRGVADDTSCGGTSLALGSYESDTYAGNSGYNCGSLLSFTASFLYGAGEAKTLLKGANLANRAWSAVKTVNQTAKALRETQKIVELAHEASPAVQKVSQAAERTVLAKETVTLSRGAENVITALSLNSKLSGLESAALRAVNTRILPDGRIRYYGPLKLAKTPGSTKGASYVTEYCPSTGKVRSWYENYDHFGNVNRVHPKNINGQTIESQHYPPIGSELP